MTHDDWISGVMTLNDKRLELNQLLSEMQDNNYSKLDELVTTIESVTVQVSCFAYDDVHGIEL